MSRARRSWIHWLFRRVIIGGPVRLLTHAKVVGWENLPKEGGFIVASNHQTYFDPLVEGVYLGRYEVHFLAKASLWNPRGVFRIAAPFMRWFMTNARAIPTRGTSQQNQDSVLSGVQELRDGEVLIIYPEGTRARDGYVHKGKTGVAQMARAAGVPIIPVAIANAGTWRRTRITIGRPIMVGRSVDRDLVAERGLTDQVMYWLAATSGRPYTDSYIERR